MARFLDTTPDFEEFARRAFRETPFKRGQLWREMYEDTHAEAFKAFHAKAGEERTPLVRELSALRDRARQAGPMTRELVEELDPRIASLLGLPAEPSPLHVLLVGSSSISAVAAPLGDDVALFHCIEWYKSPEGTRVLVAHEDTHAWHQLALGTEFPEHDLAWMAFFEGLAVRVSREVVPERPDDDYFWYGYGGFEHWLAWCRENRGEIFEKFRAALDDPGAADTWFGSGLVEGQWRVGFYVADEIVSGLDASPADLVKLSVAEGQAAFRQALGT